MTQNAATPHAHLVVSSGLLLKAAHHHAGMYQHGAGYYLLNGRWRKLHKDKPAPKGAPVAAHPKAGGDHQAVAHFTQEQWDALKLPDTNTNAPSYNKALANLQQLSDAGDVTGMLAISYGSNTYGQKLAKIANHLLGLHGSQHKVAPGQKAGTHAALQSAPAEPHPTGLPEHLAPKTTPDLQEPGPLAPLAQHVKDTLDEKAADGNVDFLKMVAANNPEHPQIVAYAKQKLAELQAKAPALEPTGNASAGTISAVDESKVPDLLAAATGPMSSKAYILAALQDKSKHKFVSMNGDAVVAAISFGVSSGTPEFPGKHVSVKNLGSSKPGQGSKLLNIAIEMAAKMGVPVALKAGNPEAAAFYKKHGFVDGKNINMMVLPVANMKVSAPPLAPPLAMPAFDEGKTTTGVKACYEKVAQKIIDHGHAGNASVLADMKADGLKPNAKGKTTNTWLGKTANSKKLLALHEAALAHATGGKPAADPSNPHDTDSTKVLHVIPSDDPQADYNVLIGTPKSAPGSKFSVIMKDGGTGEALPVIKVFDKESDALDHAHALAAGKNPAAPASQPKPEPAAVPAPAAAPAVTPETGKLTPQQLSNLQSIPWFKLKLPAENTNAKSHNAALAKIEAMAFAGDTAGLQAFIDAKGGAKQTYAKKQVLTAQTALAGLQQPGATAAVPVEPSPAKPAAPLLSGVSADTAIASFKAASPNASLADFEAKWKEANAGKVGLNAEWAMAANPAPAAPPPAAHFGPKEGDTKPGADGMLVLKNGHWVKMDTAPAVVKKLKLIDISTAIQTVTPNQTKFSSNTAGKMAATAAKAGDTTGIIAAHANALKNGWDKTAGHIVAVAQAMGVTIPTVGAIPAAAAPAPAATAPSPGAHPSMDAWTQTGGQGGSNPGGKFKDPSGQEWYCKFPGDEATAKSEVLAAKLYGLAGLSGQDAILVSKGGKVGIATKWVDIKKAPSAAALAKVDGVHSGFAVDAWLGNWDVVGMSLDNLQVGPDGKAHRVDAGGSLEYRAQGAKKPFGAKVEEIDTLRDVSKNPHAAAVFGKMTKADIVASVAKVAAISDVTIRAMVNQYGPGTQDQKAKLAETLIARKADLLKRYPQAAKKKKAVVFDPSKVSAPPSFLNWGGSGKGGPSSKEFLNKANEEAAQAIYQAAKTGNLDAIKSLQANVYDKDTGAVSGSKPALEHPSQHIKGYAQQVINEINYQMNPPKRFRFDGGHPLHSLNAAYPAHNGAGSSAAAQKLGKYIVLGTPGTVKLEDLALPPKITHSSAGGSLNQQTYSPAAQAAIAKMPATQQQAVQSYTGSSYHAMNNSLWAGNPTGAAKSAGEALKTLGHDIAPGTVLSRKINLHGADLEAMLGSSGKILQEPAIMSTSIRPSSWSGNVQLKLHVGPGVKGLWVGPGSKPGGGALSKHASEDEMILPPGTRMLIMSVKKGPDSDGFGQHGSHIIEAVILPT